MLQETAKETLAFTAVPEAVWRQIRSNSPQERLTREIRQRSNVDGIFPNREAIIRLINAVFGQLQ